MKFDYPISKIEILPYIDEVQIFIERQDLFINSNTEEVLIIKTRRTPIPLEEINNLEQFLSRDGAQLSKENLTFIVQKLKPALEALEIAVSPASEI
jgi:hypothetical protein